jgi:hypothetical protein
MGSYLTTFARGYGCLSTGYRLFVRASELAGNTLLQRIDQLRNGCAGFGHAFGHRRSIHFPEPEVGTIHHRQHINAAHFDTRLLVVNASRRLRSRRMASSRVVIHAVHERSVGVSQNGIASVQSSGFGPILNVDFMRQLRWR